MIDTDKYEGALHRVTEFLESNEQYGDDWSEEKKVLNDLLAEVKRLRERLEITSSHMNFNYPSGDSDKWYWQVELHEARVCDGVGSCAVCECTEYMVTHFKSGESDGPFITYEEAKAHYDSHDEEWREAHYIEEVRE